MTRNVRFAMAASVTLASLAFGAGSALAAAPETGALTARLPQGFTGPLQRALLLDSLSATQRTQLQARMADDKTERVQVRFAREQLQSARADQVARGTIDRAALKPQLDAETSAIIAEKAAQRATFGKLQAILTPGQMAQLDASRPANASARHRADDRHDGLAHFEAGLKLTTEQRAQIRAAIRAMRAEQGTRGPETRVQAGRESAKIVELVQAAMPLLTAEQRAALQTELRAGR